MWSLTECCNNSNGRFQSVREPLGYCGHWLALLYRILWMAGDWIDLHLLFHRWNERYVFFLLWYKGPMRCGCGCETENNIFLCFAKQDVHWKKRLWYSMATKSNLNLLRPEAEQSGWLRCPTVELSLCIQGRARNDDSEWFCQKKKKPNIQKKKKAIRIWTPSSHTRVDRVSILFISYIIASRGRGVRGLCMLYI